jgi:nitrite reductase (NADH) large subunit
MLRELDGQASIEILAEEKYLYYPRPNLIEFVAGSLPYARLFAFSEKWYGQQRIDLRLGMPAQHILIESKEVEVENGRRIGYDALLLANGASSFVPPIKGAVKKGVFTLRTLDDAQAILDYLRTHERVAVIGGGLLGLEIARALKTRSAEVEVIEFSSYLLPRQLDAQGGALLKSEMEKRGIRIRLSQATEEILGTGEVAGLRFKNGEEIQAHMAVIAAGVRPNVHIAKESGLEADRGILVNDYLETRHPQIYAAGDGIQHNGRLYGIIPASFEQAKIVAANILGQKKKYGGTVPSNTLKVAGLDLTSVGLVNPEGTEHEEIRFEKADAGIYKKIVLRDGILVGAIWLGTRYGVNSISRAVMQRTNVAQWKHVLLEDDFDFSLL